MKSAFRRRCTANMRIVNAESASIFASAASVMLELGWLRHNVQEFCLLRASTAEGWRLRCSKSGLKTNSSAVYRKGMPSSWTMLLFTRKRSCRTLQKNTRRPWYFCRRIRRNTPLLNIYGALLCGILNIRKAAASSWSWLQAGTAQAKFDFTNVYAKTLSLLNMRGSERPCANSGSRMIRECNATDWAACSLLPLAGTVALQAFGTQTHRAWKSIVESHSYLLFAYQTWFRLLL